MTARKKFRAIMAGKKLVLMPGAYDALSARVIEAEGFEAIVAGGYAGGRQHAGAGRHGPVQHARLCRATTRASATRSKSRSMSMPTPASAASTTCGRWCAPSRRPASPACSSATRCSRTAAAICRASRSCRSSRCWPSSRPRSTRAPIPTCSSRRAPTPPASKASSRDRALPVVHGGRRRHGEADGPRHHSGDQAGAARNSRARTWRRCRRRRARRRAACRSWRRPASRPRPSRRSRCLRRRTAVRNVLRLLKRDNSLAPCQEHLIPLDDYYDLVGLKALLAREESYDKAAAALTQKRAAE